jgi:hypothetical protein
MAEEKEQSRQDRCAFIAETPVDEEGDEERNVGAPKRLIKKQG